MRDPVSLSLCNNSQQGNYTTHIHTKVEITLWGGGNNCKPDIIIVFALCILYMRLQVFLVLCSDTRWQTLRAIAKRKN